MATPVPVKTPPPPATRNVRGRRMGYRWTICGLLFFATTVCYVDRQVISILKTDVLFGSLGWGENDFANVVAAFQIAYALGYLLAGRLFDRIGVRIGLALAVGLWSLAAVAHGLVSLLPADATVALWLPRTFRSASWVVITITPVPVLATVLGFAAARVGLGLAEGGNFPASIKAVSEWFPRRERALATGLFNAGSNVGVLVAALVVPYVTLQWGWPAAFYLTGGLGLLWLAFWVPMYERPERRPGLSRAELDYIRSDPVTPSARIPWLRLLRYRQTWAFVVGMSITAPIWWFYLYWTPGFLQDVHGLKIADLPLPLVTIYMLADLGSLIGGWLSGSLIRRGWSVNSARKTTFLACALCVVPVFAASQLTGLWAVTLLIGLACAAHQGFSANLYTLVSDTVPGEAVSSVVGIGGTAGALSGMFFAKAAGWILSTGGEGRYTVLFAFAAVGYLVALAIIHLLLPRMEPMKPEARLTTE